MQKRKCLGSGLLLAVRVIHENLIEAAPGKLDPALVGGAAKNESAQESHGGLNHLL